MDEVSDERDKQYNTHARRVDTRPDAATLSEISDLIDAGEVEPTISTTFPLADAPEDRALTTLHGGSLHRSPLDCHHCTRNPFNFIRYHYVSKCRPDQYDELAAFLTKSNPLPEMAVPLTGTALVPEDNFTLHSDDIVEISIENIGTLTNAVRQV